MVQNQNRVLQKKPAYEKQMHDARAIDRTFMASYSFLALNFQEKSKWIPTAIENQLSKLTFMVRLCDGRLWKIHQDHLRQRRSDEPQQIVAGDEWTPPTLRPGDISLVSSATVLQTGRG